MSYPYFFIYGLDSEKVDRIKISGDDNNHLKNVLRAKKGDRVTVSSKEHIYECRIDSLGSSDSELEVLRVSKVPLNPYSLTVFQSVLKKRAMELVIQKTAELGIDHIIPVITSRVIIDSPKVASKVSRWQEIAHQASKQSKRPFVPEVKGPVYLEGIDVSDYDLFFAPLEDNRLVNTPYEEIETILKDKDKTELAYLIGPEGGFNDDEIRFLSGAGVKLVNFGPNILRSETASIYFLSVLDYILKTKK